MSKCQTSLLSKDRVGDSVIAYVSAGNLVDTFVPIGGNVSIEKTDLASKSPSSHASCTQTWEAAEVALDSNLVKELIEAIDGASQIVGQITAQSTSLLQAIQKVVETLIDLQRSNERSLELTWDFKVDVKKETAFLVKHSHIIAWKATKIGPLKGIGRVVAKSSVILPDGTTSELDILANHTTNSSQQRFPDNACHVTYLSTGERVSNIRTTLLVSLPSVADQVGEILEDFARTIQKLSASLTKGIDELKQTIQSALTPDIFKVEEPKDEKSAIELLKESMAKFFEILRKLVGEVSGRVSLEHSVLSFQAVTDEFYDSWLNSSKEAHAKAEFSKRTEKSQALQSSSVSGENGENEEILSPSAPQAFGSSAIEEEALDSNPSKLDRYKSVLVKDGVRLNYDTLRPGKSKVTMGIYHYRELTSPKDKKPDK